MYGYTHKLVRGDEGEAGGVGGYTTSSSILSRCYPSYMDAEKEGRTSLAQAGGGGDGEAVAGELGELGVVLGHERLELLALLEALVAGVDVGAHGVEHGAHGVVVGAGEGLLGVVQAVGDVVVRLQAVLQRAVRQRLRLGVGGERRRLLLRLRRPGAHRGHRQPQHARAVEPLPAGRRRRSRSLLLRDGGGAQVRVVRLQAQAAHDVAVGEQRQRRGRRRLRLRLAGRRGVGHGGVPWLAARDADGRGRRRRGGGEEEGEEEDERSTHGVHGEGGRNGRSS
jgi:hypothetical protein